MKEIEKNKNSSQIINNNLDFKYEIKSYKQEIMKIIYTYIIKII